MILRREFPSWKDYQAGRQVMGAYLSYTKMETPYALTPEEDGIMCHSWEWIFQRLLFQFKDKVYNTAELDLPRK